MSKKQTPSEFLKLIIGRPVVVKLNSGVDYRGTGNNSDKCVSSRFGLPKSESRKNAICHWQKRCVLISFEFVSIDEIDMMNERFQCEVIIESKWLVTNQFKTDKDYDPKVHWNPELYIENAHTNFREQIKYAVSRENEMCYVTEYRLVKGNFWQRVEMENFPVDVQKLSIVLTTRHGSDEIYLLSDPDKLSHINVEASNKFYEQQKWSLLKLVKISETAAYDLQHKSKRKQQQQNAILSAKFSIFKPPKIVATCFSARKPGFYLLNAYFLVFLITFIAFPVFSIDIKSPHFRLTTSYTILLTSVSFKWVLNNKLPSVSIFTSLDKYQVSSISFVCLLILWHSLVGSLWDREYGQFLDHCSFIVFAVIFILMQCVFGVWLYCAYAKKRNIKREEAMFLLMYKERFSMQNQKLSFDRVSIEMSSEMNGYDEAECDTDNLTAVVCSQ